MFLFDAQLFWYRLVFMTELLVAEGLFTYKLKKRKHFFLRAAAATVASYAFTFLFPIATFDAFYISVMFFALFAFTVFALAFCYNAPLLSVFFCALAAYTVQHTAYEIYSFIVTVSGLDVGNTGAYGQSGGGAASNENLPFTAIIYADSYAVIYWLAYLFFGTRIRKNADLRINNVYLLVLAALIVVVDIVLNAVVTYRVDADSDMVLVIVTYIYNVLCCVLALLIQFGLLTQKKIEKELDTVHRLWHEDQEHYALTKENIDLINLKCHDLKHQIRRIGRSGKLSDDMIREMESAISIYDSTVKTGNEALDVILTEKSLYCQKNNIKLTCMADGEKLAFMSQADIYSLFGNALDNAVEAVGKLKEEDKRTIGLTVKSSREFLSVSIHNYYDDEIEFEGGLPLTTKDDKRYHGFGMKSIKLITEKYDGELSVVAKNGIFNLNLIFPLSDF